MSTELKVVDSSALSESECAELDSNIDALISAHKNNRQEINRLVFESVAAMTTGEDYERQLANKKGLRRFIGGITGSSKELQDKINSSRAAAQYASQQTLQRLAEQNLMSFDLITAVNNKLNASILSIEGEINQAYQGIIQVHHEVGQVQSGVNQVHEELCQAQANINQIRQTLVTFFKKNLSDMMQLNNRVERLERNVNLLNWQNSIEYQMFGDTEYTELDDMAKVVCLVRDFYDITHGEWTTSDLLLLKAAMGDIGVSPKSKINYFTFIRAIFDRKELQGKLLNEQQIEGIPSPDYLPVLSGVKKLKILDSEENYVVATTANLLAGYQVSVETERIADGLATNYLAQEGAFNANADVECFHLILELLFSLRQAQEEGILGSGTGYANTDQMDSISPSADELYEQGKQYEDDQDWVEAVRCYQAAAELGHAAAQCSLGDCYDNGDGIPKDKVKAAEWYRKAAEQGNADAQNELGFCYDNGDGVTENKAKAIQWYTKAAEQGNTDAQYNLGFCYKNGNGVSQNYEKAVEWFTKATEQGDADAQFELGLCYEKGNGVPQNYARAVEWYTKAAEQGSAEAQNNLGLCYKTGRGVSQSYEKAVEWYTKAAEQGDTNAQFNLGLCYEIGNGVSQSYAKAVEWYTKAAEQGNANAQLNLGWCYEKGKGVSQSYAKAVEWYTKAAEQGNDHARLILGLR